MKRNPIKIILLSLPIPEFYNYYQKGNHQLFKDYFKSYIEILKQYNNSKNFDLKNIINNIEIIDIPRTIIDNFNNNSLIKTILSLGPDIVGLSSYLWNTERNISISKELKKYGIITIAGGPDIQNDNNYIFKENAFDYYIIGEGEYKLLYLIFLIINKFYISNKSYIINNSYNINKSNNINKSYTNSNNNKNYIKNHDIKIPQIIDDYTFNSDLYLYLKNFFIKKYDEIILKYIDLSEDFKTDKLFYIETERGCPFNCSFCAYSKFRKQILSLSTDKFYLIFDKIITKSLDEIYILSPTLNRNKKNFNCLLEIISLLLKKYNKKNITFFGELRSEFLDRNDIENLANANFREIEFGVQSLRKDVLSKLNRNTTNYNLSDFTKLLLKNNITPIIDFIIGLPDETYDDLIETIEFLDNKGIIKYCNFYHLLLLPSTELKFKFIKNGYKFQNNPPYLALNTNKLNLEKIKNIYMYLETEKDISYYDEFTFMNKDKIYKCSNTKDLNSLFNTFYYHTANFLFFDIIFKQLNENIYSTILKFYSSFFKKNSDIFHILYLITNKNISFNFLYELKKEFKEYKNYYDKFHLSIDFFGDELFSKRLEILTKPEIFLKFYEKKVIDFNFNFIYLQNEQMQFIKDLDLLKNLFIEHGLTTYISNQIDIPETFKKEYSKNSNINFNEFIKIINF